MRDAVQFVDASSFVSKHRSRGAQRLAAKRFDWRIRQAGGYRQTVDLANFLNICVRRCRISKVTIRKVA